MRPRPLRLLALLCAVGAGAARAEPTGRLIAVTAAPQQYGRTDLVCLVRGAWNDPFDSGQIRVDLRLTAPSGRQLTLPCYFDSGSAATTGVWKARFTPTEAGEYAATLEVGAPGQSADAASLRFGVAPRPGRGFLHAGDAWSLRFDDGERFRGVGENIGWESRTDDDSKYFHSLNQDPRFTYDYLLGRLHACGGNFFRTWMCPWNLPLEWAAVTNRQRYSDDHRRFNRSAAERLDELCGVAEATDTYFMLTLIPHVALLGDGWRRSAYNRANGGPAASAGAFFTDPEAKRRFKDTLRYLVARWGYSAHLGVWEFFNEVDNAMYGQKPWRIPDADVAAWHREMAAYLRALDPYGRPITTSISHREVAGLDDIPAIDFNQRHIYRNTGAIPGAIRSCEATFGKPCVVGEFAYEWDWSKDFDAFADRMDGDFRHGLWLGLFSPTPILPMSWWWEYFDERGTVASLAPVRALSDEMMKAGKAGLSEARVGWRGRPSCSALAVAAGTRIYVLVTNSAGAEAAGSVTGLPGPGERAVLVDAQSGERRALPDVAGDGSVPVSLRAGSDTILVVGGEDAR